jgi:hypothetical protein
MKPKIWTSFRSHTDNNRHNHSRKIASFYRLKYNIIQPGLPWLEKNATASCVMDVDQNTYCKLCDGCRSKYLRWRVHEILERWEPFEEPGGHQLEVAVAHVVHEVDVEHVELKCHD